MGERKKKKQVYKSMREFEKEFFPNSLKESSSKVPTDARVLGASLAKESLDVIKNRLRK